jgi:hypothetical protein
MFDRNLERLNRIAKQVFGTDAELKGTVGTATGPGELRIDVNGRTIGRGASFQEVVNQGIRSLPRKQS